MKEVGRALFAKRCGVHDLFPFFSRAWRWPWPQSTTAQSSSGVVRDRNQGADAFPGSP